MHLEEEDEALSPGGCTNVESEPWCTISGLEWGSTERQKNRGQVFISRHPQGAVIRTQKTICWNFFFQTDILPPTEKWREVTLTTILNFRTLSLRS
jgi:hypothetical protein